MNTEISPVAAGDIARFLNPKSPFERALRLAVVAVENGVATVQPVDRAGHFGNVRKVPAAALAKGEVS